LLLLWLGGLVASALGMIPRRPRLSRHYSIG